MRLKTTFLFILVLLVVVTLQPVNAFELPPVGSVAYIQTSGPNAGINIGDFYTSVAGDNSIHEIQIYVPCGVNPTTPITFAVYDPETAGPNPAVPPFAQDEIRPAGAPVPDTVTFTLTAPNGAVVGPRIFNDATSNARWVEIVTTTTATPGFGCGAYVLTTSVSDDDDNAWRLRVAHDPECSVSTSVPGTCSPVNDVTSGLMGNNVNTDDIDGLPGTGDELFVSFSRLSLQHQGLGCQSFFFYVDGTQPSITLNNFDMDFTFSPANISITYTPPTGSQYAPSVAGTPSLSSSWNGAPTNTANNPNPPRVGDTFAIAAQDIGWWSAELCVNDDNQYIFEGLENEPVFFDQPPFPIMTVNKDNGVTTVSSNGEQVTYTINYANINPAGPPTNGGAALETIITDTLPTGATFVKLLEWLHCRRQYCHMEYRYSPCTGAAEYIQWWQPDTDCGFATCARWVYSY
jgi:hypothetical protein